MTGTSTPTDSATNTATATGTPTGTPTAVYPFLRFITAPDSLNYVAVAGSGNVTLYSGGHNSTDIYVFTGTDSGGPALSATVATSGYDNGIAVDAAGVSVFFDDDGGGLPNYYLARAGLTLASPTTWPTSSSGVQGVALDSSDNIYVADDNVNQVIKYTSAGVSVASWGGYGWPRGLAVDNSRSVLYAGDYASGRVLKSGLDGSNQGTFASLPVQYGNSPAPWGVAVDSTGNVFVTDYSSAFFYKYDPSGNLLATVNVGVLTAPIGISVGGIAVDANGYVYIADQAQAHLIEFAPY